MKRITEIKLENFRVFFESYTISLHLGENLLIYGENGSGKSSLYKAISDFLSSSRDADFEYVKNYYRILDEGMVTITFSSFDTMHRPVVSSFSEVVSFGSDFRSSSAAGFLKDADMVKGFLGYRNLLNVYHHDVPEPNLFQLIVVQLLHNYSPIGGTYSLGEKYLELDRNLREVHNRNERRHKQALAELPEYESVLSSSLKDIFIQLNYFLIKYFKLNLRVGYILHALGPYDYNAWRIPSKLTLDIRLNGVRIAHQADFLNEARLSALSICLYLAALKRNPQLLEFKVLYLDDVFIGLDATNRLPILNILSAEFYDYQVFISTYDRHLFEIAKRKFNNDTHSKWKTVELYVGHNILDTGPLELPILVNGETNFEKATKYLHNRLTPDYPAAANYFRKSLEEVIRHFTPKWETTDEETVQIPDFKLGVLLSRLIRFLDKVRVRHSWLDQLSSLLPSLLHPLSHHDITSPVYRGELVLIEGLVPKINGFLEDLDIQENYKCSVLEGKNKLRITFVIDSAFGHLSVYELRTSEALVLIKDSGSSPKLSGVGCFVERCWGDLGGTVIRGSSKSFSLQERERFGLYYLSLEEAYDRLYLSVSSNPSIGPFPKQLDYVDAFTFQDTHGAFQPLRSALVW